MTAQLYFEDVSVRTAISVLVVIPTEVQLFRFSAVTWNAHRIHYDRNAALAEGHPDILVQAHLHGAFLTRMVMAWIGPRGRLHAIEWRNRGRAVPADTLTCSAVVKRTYLEAGKGHVELDLSEVNQRGELCVTGTANTSLPLRLSRAEIASEGPSAICPT